MSGTLARSGCASRPVSGPVLARDGPWSRVAGLEALDGRPVLDVKPVLGALDER
ncbi:hypothetical protein [Micromonospora sp. 067-2]|uniref:hypothetical protein n=1 Tax=Micromonospora sp. 067-2 TaxID=2789270 RepID=UPI00397DAD48